LERQKNEDILEEETEVSPRRHFRKLTPEKEKRILYYLKQEDLSPAEIADVLKCSRSVVYQVRDRHKNKHEKENRQAV
jgi:DNA-directed RNA polymerase specialized sigma subunit